MLWSEGYLGCGILAGLMRSLWECSEKLTIYSETNLQPDTALGAHA